MQYFDYQGTLCRLYQNDAGNVCAEGWDVSVADYAPISAAAVLRNGDILSPADAFRWAQELRRESAVS